MPFSSTQDEVFTPTRNAARELRQIRKARAELNAVIDLSLDDELSGDEVERYLSVDHFKSPSLPKDDVARVILDTRKLTEQQLFAREQQDVQVVQAPSQLRCREIPRFSFEPASQRVPPEIWEEIAVHIPRHHLRTWLFVSPFHRNIASRRIFHTIDLFLDEDKDNLSRSLDIFGRATNDPVFASRVKSLRLRMTRLLGGTLLELMIHMLETSLPAFKALRSFEWVGSPSMPVEIVLTLAKTKHLHQLGLIGWNYDLADVSAIDKLRKFTFRVVGSTDMKKIRTLLNRNKGSLKHLVLGGFLDMGLSWDLAFESVTIQNLTHIHLVDTCVSHVVLSRIASANNLQSLTLHRAFADPESASVVFNSDRILNGSHTLWPQLEAFRCILIGPGDQRTLYHSIVHSLRKRDKLRRLDLGSCPWGIVQDILPDLINLRALAVQIYHVSKKVVNSLVMSIPGEMVAVRLSVGISESSLDRYAGYFSRFNTLSFLDLQSEPGLLGQDNKILCSSIAAAISSLDFLVRNQKPYVVIRPNGGEYVQLKDLPIGRSWNYGSGVDFGSDDAAWVEQKDIPLRF